MTLTKFRTMKDTYKFNADKQSHLGISFGLFYFFITYLPSITLSIILTITVGLSFELYQGVSTRYSGWSTWDMLYNLLGLTIGAGLYILRITAIFPEMTWVRTIQ